MELKEIASVSGKPGLFRIVKPTRTGVIIETLDEKKTRLVVGGSHRVSVLEEVSIYTNDNQDAATLASVLRTTHEKYQGNLETTAKSPSKELKDFIEDILPNYDKDRVHISDIKKLVSWYHILAENSAETLDGLLEGESNTEKTDNSSEEESQES